VESTETDADGILPDTAAVAVLTLVQAVLGDAR